MKLITYLMEEHRIIENALHMFEIQMKKLSEENHIDPISMYVSIDIVRVYADLTHHGKEEDILFRELSQKPLSLEHAEIMNGLTEEHQYSRSIVSKWITANDRYFYGYDTSEEILSCLKELTEFYPKHIKKKTSILTISS